MHSSSLTLDPRSLKIISTSKIFPNCCKEKKKKETRKGLAWPFMICEFVIKDFNLGGEEGKSGFTMPNLQHSAVTSTSPINVLRKTCYITSTGRQAEQTNTVTSKLLNAPEYKSHLLHLKRKTIVHTVELRDTSVLT